MRKGHVCGIMFDRGFRNGDIVEIFGRYLKSIFKFTPNSISYLLKI